MGRVDEMIVKYLVYNKTVIIIIFILVIFFLE